MKKVGKPVFFIVALAIAVVGYLSIFGLRTSYGDTLRTQVKGADDIRWGIDIRGGVDVTFSPPEGVEATREEMSAAEAIIKVRLVSQNITDSEVYTDYDKNRIIVRFPWKAEESDFNPEQAIAELGETALLTFREGTQTDEEGHPSGPLVVEGKHVISAQAVYDTSQNSSSPVFMVSLKLDEEGTASFAEATGRLVGTSTPISIWMDDTMISAPTVDGVITNGEAVISGNFTSETATDLANKIQAGALPFKLETENFSTISPTLGAGAKDAMVLAGVIAFAAISVLLLVIHRLPGVVAVIALAGQLFLMIASVTGFFPVFPSFTLTLPGIAGIILSLGFGVDANIITSERIREELANGKTLDGAIDAGFSRAFSAIFDANMTGLIVAVVLMGSFGPPEALLSKVMSPLFFMFGPSTAGSIYSFGYTLLVGVILNQLMGVFATRLMLKSLSRFKALRNPILYGGEKA